MAAQSTITRTDDPPEHPPLVGPSALEDALAHVATGAFTHGTEHRVGLELELHLVDLTDPGRRPDWSRVRALLTALPPMPSGSSVTLEPGAQIELSTPPHDDVTASIGALRADLAVLRSAMRAEGFGGAALGADPARPVHRINPGARYAAMEQHFEALGCARPGREMMSATAALQVNLDAGPTAQWPQRLGLIRSLVPMLVAASSASPWLGGRTSGWHSMRQETWYGIDAGRSDPVPVGEPSTAWALYAMAAPVMLVAGRGESAQSAEMTPVTRRVTFGEWILEPGLLSRAPTLDDLDYHLSTLFPPVRPRGYVEIRCIDALPDAWWPALAALTATLVDDPVAADRAAELCEPVAHRWEDAARSGIADPGLRAAVVGCAEIAVERCPDQLRPEVEAFAELVASGRTISSELRAVADTHGPLRLLEEEADA